MASIIDTAKSRFPNGWKSIKSRLKMWVNKGLQALNIGVIFGENEEKLIMWKRGGTLNPCADCLALDGQIKTAEQWQAAGIEPQSPDLECGGWNCLCRFVLV